MGGLGSPEKVISTDYTSSNPGYSNESPVRSVHEYKTYEDWIFKSERTKTAPLSNAMLAITSHSCSLHFRS